MSARTLRICSTLTALAMPAVAAAGPITPVAVVANATAVAKLILLCLLVLIGAAVVVCARTLASGPRLAGGSAFLAGLRLGGPLTGLMGAAWSGFMMSMGLANIGRPAPINVLAPGLAEMSLMIVLGLLAGAVGVVGTWAVEARIDRAVLNG